MDRTRLLVIISYTLILGVLAAGCTTVQQGNTTQVPAPGTGSMSSISANQKTYPAYIAAPGIAGTYPGIVLIHSFNGLEPGYKVMCDRIASDGFVVIAPEWQTFGRQAGDPEVEEVIRSSITALRARRDVNPQKIGLTGFCAGGRFTIDKYYELKVYQGKPHGFMIVNGSLARDSVAEDAYSEMTGFFRRMLG